MKENQGVAPEAVEAAPGLAHDTDAGGIDDMTTPKPHRTTSPAFQFYPNDFLGSSKVQRMSLTERGAYITLLAHCWLDGGLPTDLTKLAAMLHVKALQFDRMWSGALGECFTERSGKLVNPRLELESKKQIDYRRRQSDRSTTSWQSRKKRLATPEPMQALHTPGNALHLQSSSSSSSSSSKERERRAAPIARRRNPNAAFEGARGLDVLQGQHRKFLDLLNGSVSESELVQWYEATAEDWSTGNFREMTPDANLPRFWDARFVERWPPTPSVNPKVPAWAR